MVTDSDLISKYSQAAAVVVDYDPDWVRLFEEERERLLEACGGAVVALEHIGSTSVPGLPAKPIIDMMPGLARLEDGLRCITPLVARLGYESLGEFGIPDRLYFRKREPFPYHAHMFVVGHPEWDRHLLFRDYLRAHPDTAADYAALKRDLVERVGNPEARFRGGRDNYADGKTDFIRSVEERARNERRSAD